MNFKMSAKNNQVVVASHIVSASPGRPMDFGPISFSSAVGTPQMPLEAIDKAYVDAGDAANRAHVDDIVSNSTTEEFLEQSVAPVRDELTQTISGTVQFCFPDSVDPTYINTLQYTKQGKIVHVKAYVLVTIPEGTSPARIIAKLPNGAQGGLLPTSCLPTTELASACNTSLWESVTWEPSKLITAAVIPAGSADAGCIAFYPHDGSNFGGGHQFSQQFSMSYIVD